MSFQGQKVFLEAVLCQSFHLIFHDVHQLRKKDHNGVKYLMRKDVSKSPPSPKAIANEPLCVSSQGIALR